MIFPDGPSPCANGANYRQLDFLIGDWVYNKWHRTYVDNLGGRVFLSSNLENGSMVMTGHKSTADGVKQDVRVTFTPDGVNRVVETWEVLMADGVTYEAVEKVVRVRKASAN